MVNYYFDTSIWLDFFENRDEPNFSKGEWAHKLIINIINNDDKIVYSDNVITELRVLGFSIYEINEMFKPLRHILIYARSTEKQFGKAKDLALKRNIPKRDALHALIARDNKSIMITWDKDFQKLKDIVDSKNSKDLI